VISIAGIVEHLHFAQSNHGLGANSVCEGGVKPCCLLAGPALRCSEVKMCPGANSGDVDLGMYEAVQTFCL
jgi:hypothetical protein